MAKCMMGSECEVWKRMEGVMWCGVDKKSSKMGAEGCALLTSSMVWKGNVEANGWKGSRIVCSQEDKNNEICMNLCVSVTCKCEEWEGKRGDERILE